MIKAILFDLDGTLLDTLDDLANSVNYALEFSGLSKRSREEIRRFVGNGVQTLMKRALPETHKEDSKAKQIMLEAFSTHYEVHSNDLTAPYYGILEMLETLSLSSYRLAVLSNKPHEALVDLCHKHFNNQFEKVYGAREGVPKKPSSIPLLSLIEEMGLSPQEVIYVGDSEVDIETAKNANVEIIAVNWGFRDDGDLKALAPDKIVSHPDEIVAYVLSK